MLLTTARYSKKETREFARILAFFTGSFYLARGKKPLDKISLLSFRKGCLMFGVLYDDLRLVFFQAYDFGRRFFHIGTLKIKNYEIIKKPTTLLEVESSPLPFFPPSEVGGEVVIEKKDNCVIFKDVQGKLLLRLEAEWYERKDENRDKGF